MVQHPARLESSAKRQRGLKSRKVGFVSEMSGNYSRPLAFGSLSNGMCKSGNVINVFLLAVRLFNCPLAATLESLQKFS